jgi:hypothetical protein
MAYGMAYGMAEWQEWRNGGMAYRMAYGMAEWQEWRNGIRNGGMAYGMAYRMAEWRNGGMAYGMAYGMAGMAQMRKGMVRKGNRAKGYITCIEEGNVTKQSSTKGYEDELQAHFNSIIQQYNVMCLACESTSSQQSSSPHYSMQHGKQQDPHLPSPRTMTLQAAYSN